MQIGRLSLVHRLLGPALASVNLPDRPLRLLDCGGGSGAYAVPLAVEGADVTVIDISADALATLQRRAREAGVSDKVHAVQADVENQGVDQLSDESGWSLAGSFDAVLAHGILEAVESVPVVFTRIAATVRAGGLLSVLVNNPAAGVVARAVAGQPAAALAELRELEVADRAVDPDSVARLCAAAGLVVEERHGIGVFSDLVPGSALDSPEARDALVELDAEAAGRSPFAEIAGRVHLLARRPAG